MRDNLKLTYKLTLHVRQRLEDDAHKLVPWDEDLRDALARAIDRNLPSSWVLDVVQNDDLDPVVIVNVDSVVE